MLSILINKKSLLIFGLIASYFIFNYDLFSIFSNHRDNSSILNSEIKEFTSNKVDKRTDKLQSDNQWDDYDNDGLTNFFEINILKGKTNLYQADTDKNGIKDSDEDFDSDGLTNFEEQLCNTDPLNKDTDDDLLSDYDEYVMGTDPLKKDSDDDGILDNDEKYDTSVSNDNGISITMTGSGNIAAKCSITEIEPDSFISNLPGLVSDIIDLKSEKKFDKAELRIPLKSINSRKVSSLSNLRVVYIDYNNQKIEIPKNQGISHDNRYLYAYLDHFSPYAVIDHAAYKKSFSQNFYGSTRLNNKKDNVNNGIYGIDIILAIDSSGSMKTNDPSFMRITAAKNLIDQLDETKDQVAVIDFDGKTELLQGLTSDFEEAKDKIDMIDSLGKTNISLALTKSIEQLEDTLAFAQIIVLLSDGKSIINDSIIKNACDLNIKIYTIGLGQDINESLLKNIANKTGGLYFYADKPEDIIIPFDRISEESIDSDNDGLSDIAEKKGMLTWCGYIAYSDPFSKDTDGDNLLDGEEMVAIGVNEDGDRIYKMKSNPNSYDSDEDGISDFDEIYPPHDQEASNPLIINK